MASIKKLQELREFIEAAYLSLEQARTLIRELAPQDKEATKLQEKAKELGADKLDEAGLRVIEGVFDGQNMVGPEGKQYSVPANYASKSKLVEGDILKLTIARDGSFIYKQIGPVERKRLVGTLVRDPETEEFRVLAEGRTYKVLMASVTYFKGAVGDEVVLLTPKIKEAKWGAVENIIKKKPETASPAVTDSNYVSSEVAPSSLQPATAPPADKIKTDQPNQAQQPLVNLSSEEKIQEVTEGPPLEEKTDEFLKNDIKEKDQPGGNRISSPDQFETQLSDSDDIEKLL